MQRFLSSDDFFFGFSGYRNPIRYLFEIQKIFFKPIPLHVSSLNQFKEMEEILFRPKIFILTEKLTDKYGVILIDDEAQRNRSNRKMVGHRAFSYYSDILVTGRVITEAIFPQCLYRQI